MIWQQEGDVELTQYLSSKEYAKKHGVHVITVRKLLAQRKIPGVIMTSSCALIPSDAKYPSQDDKQTYNYEKCTFLSLHEYVTNTHVSVHRIMSLFKNGELDGVIKVGERLYFPPDFKLPQDKRLKSGKYVGWRDKYGKSKETSDDS